MPWAASRATNPPPNPFQNTSTHTRRRKVWRKTNLNVVRMRWNKHDSLVDQLLQLQLFESCLAKMQRFHFCLTKRTRSEQQQHKNHTRTHRRQKKITYFGYSLKWGNDDASFDLEEEKVWSFEAQINNLLRIHQIKTAAFKRTNPCTGLCQETSSFSGVGELLLL